MMTRGGSCHRHRSAAAGWRCAGGHGDLCGACAAVRKVGTALIWGPAAPYGILGKLWDIDEVLSLRDLADPVLWLLVVAGALYVPMALMAAATDISLLGMLNPVAIVRSIRRVGRDYFTATG